MWHCVDTMCDSYALPRLIRDGNERPLNVELEGEEEEEEEEEEDV